MAQRAACLLLCAAALLLQGANALYSASSPVVQLDSSNFKTKVKNAGLMLVEFYAPWCGHCKNLQPEYEKAAKALEGFASIAAVDADAHKDLQSEYGIQGYPTIKLVYMEGDKIKTQEYNGGRTAKDIINYVMDKAKNFALKKIGEKASSGGSGSGSAGSAGGSGGSGGNGGCGAGGGSAGAADSGNGPFYVDTDVVILTDADFDEQVRQSDDLWFVEFYAPWCGYCKALKPAWIEAAKELKGKVKVGAVDCTQHQSVCTEVKVNGYPTIKFFGADKTSPEDYNGGRDSGSIVNHARQQWAALAPPPEPVELVDQHAFEKECIGDAQEGISPKQLCLVAFLPDLLDSKAAGRSAYLDTLKQLANKYKERPFSYLWVGALKQQALEANFGVGGFGYPALIAFNPKEKKYSTAKVAFEAPKLIEFVDRIRKGGESVAVVQGSLATLNSITPWNGGEATEEIVEEFSLEDLGF